MSQEGKVEAQHRDVGKDNGGVGQQVAGETENYIWIKIYFGAGTDEQDVGGWERGREEDSVDLMNAAPAVISW